jgi:uncharacterized membrane protein YsdA (DUF1294 family)
MAAFLQTTAALLNNYWWLILTILLLWNGIVYSVYAEDKRRALKKEWRISEADLLAVAFMGGAIGAIAACMVTRHKTNKKSFAGKLFMIALIQMLLFGGFVGLAIVMPT